ncbi:MAG: LysR family transcriptional regulator [Pseudomonadota bacterium]
MNPAELLDLMPDLAVFARVVEAGSFSAAAHQLGSTPSTVSRQIKRLEERLGVRLLERSTRRLRVTDSGAQVYRHCRDMLDAASSAADAAGESTGRARGRVSLSAPTAFAKTVLHPLVPGFLGTHPDVDLRLVFSDRDVDPLTDDVDLVIRLTDQPPPGLAGRPLGVVRWVLCAAPEYLAARGMPNAPQELVQHDCLHLGESPDDSRWRFRRGVESATVTVHSRYVANHAGARLDAAIAGLGIANLPDFVARDALTRGAVERVLTDWTLDARAYIGTVWLLYPPNRFLPPKVRVLIDHLVARLAPST